MRGCANVAGLAAGAAVRVDPHSAEVETAIRTARDDRPELRGDTGEALAYMLLERTGRSSVQSVETSLRVLGEDAVGSSIEALNDSRPSVSRTALPVLAVRMFDHASGFRSAESWTATDRAPLSRRVEALSFEEFSTRAHVALALGDAGSRSLALLPLLAASVLDRDRRQLAASGFALLAIVVDLVVLALGWIGFRALVVEYEPLWARLALGPWAALFATLSIVASFARSVPVRLARTSQVLLFALAAAVVTVELGLRAFASLRPTTLLARNVSGFDRILEAQREAPGSSRIGFRCNESGHYDGPFVRTILAR